MAKDSQIQGAYISGKEVMRMLRIWDPILDLEAIRESIYRTYNNRSTLGGQAAYPLDLLDEKDNYIVRASLPGFRPEDINIKADNQGILITAQTGRSGMQQRYILRERPEKNSFIKRIRLPINIDVDNIKAKLHNGELTIVLPKIRRERTQTIKITSSSK